MKFLRSALLVSMSVTALASTAYADDFKFEADPIVNLRFRAEQVDQDGRDDTTALTLRGRFGSNFKFAPGLSALVEAESVVHLNDDFSDTVDTVPGKAVVADPEAFELNRLQIAWKGEKTNATLGRQRIILDGARYVGNVGFRQNEQTYDAVRFGLTPLDNISVDYIYIDKVHRIFGDDHPLGEFDSDSHVARVSAKSVAGQFVVTALLLDFDEAPAATGKTYAIDWSKGFETDIGKIGVKASLAQQSEYNGNGPTEDLGYQSFGLSFSKANITALAAIDILEGSNGRGFTTPLATLHKFQGWADVFLATPATGIRDISVGVKGKGLSIIPDAKPANWAIIYHDFSSDNDAISYGSEFDAVFRLPINDWLTVEAKGAVFSGDGAGFGDRTKFWLAIESSF